MAQTSQPSVTPLASQGGIKNRSPEHVIVAALTLPSDGAQAANTLSQLKQIEAAELTSQLSAEDAATPKNQPSPETGELGFADGFDRAHLTITTGLAMTAFDKLGTPAASRPQDLVPIPWKQLGDAPVQAASGDVVLQICSDDPYICEHVLHRVTYEVGGQLSLVWAQAGVQRYSSRSGRTSRAEGRALTGFVDGTSNLDPNDCDGLDQKLIFVDPTACSGYPPVPPPEPPPGYGQPTPANFPTDLRPPPATEPMWTEHGSYMVVRASLVNFDQWDRATLGTQEASIGRFKYSGAFLDLPDDPAQLGAAPAFASNQQDTRVPITAHARKANPRGPGDDQRRFFRRGYPLLNGSTAGIERGLLFVAFGRTISTQFEFAFRAWMRNTDFPTSGSGVDAFLAFEKQVLCGGYYFVPPIADPCDPTSWIVPSP